jgi:exosortase family protein XrtM
MARSGRRRRASAATAHISAEGTRELRARRVRFVAVFLAVALTLIGLYHYPYPDGSWPREILGFHLRAYARAAGAVLRLFDRSISVDGVLINGRYPLRIVRSCDGAEAVALAVAAVVAFPVALPRRLVGLAVAVAALFAVNVVRICSLYFVGVLRPDRFDVAHLELWPPVFVLAAALIFLAWARWAQEGGRGESADPA